MVNGRRIFGEKEYGETMNNQNFTTTISVEQTPEKVFHASNNLRGWWSEEIEGDTDKTRC